MKILTKENRLTTNWSGGTTSQLFIYPEGSSFSEGDYDLRISLATVETSPTVFTKLEGVTRTLMVLEGSQLLEHENKHTADLKTFQQDTFSGDWNTKCIGTSVNFNVMCKNDQFVRVQSIPLVKGMKGKLDLVDTLVFLYFKEGSVTIDGELIEKDTSVVLDKSVNLVALENAIMIEVIL